MDYDDISYDDHADLLYDLAGQVVDHLGGYLDCDVLPDLPADLTFVDCGAYDGDSIEEFVGQRGASFSRIIAFEPDPDNFRRLKDSIGRQPPQVANKIDLYASAVGERHGLSQFRATGDMGASLSESGEASR